jgi:hypothetical protein
MFWNSLMIPRMYRNGAGNDWKILPKVKSRSKVSNLSLAA